MTDTMFERGPKRACFTDWHIGVRIYRGGWPIEQCENEMQRAGYMDALRAEADAETAIYLAKHPQAVAA